jgi:hypothetical protein
MMDKIHSPDEVLSTLNKKYEVPGWANPRRYNYKLWTSSQIMMDLTNLEVTLVIDKDTEFLGVDKRFEKDYEPKITISVKYEQD